MASFIDGLRQNQQQAQDAEAYRALVRQAEDNSLARSAAMQTKAAYDNADIGYGLTRADIAQITGRPTSEVSYDTLGDADLQQLGYAKQMSQRGPVVDTRERVPLSPEMVANQANMQQAAQDVQNGRLGLAGQLVGRGVPSANNVALNAYVGNINKPTGGINQNADRVPMGMSTDEITDRLPSGDQEIKMMKQKGAY